jgi:hypothetical protein
MHARLIVPNCRSVSPRLKSTSSTVYSRRFTTPSSKRSSEIVSFRNLVARLGYITNHGLPIAQAPLAAKILTGISSEWREMVAGSEGFLTVEGRRGLFRRSVEWGDMVSGTDTTETHG